MLLMLLSFICTSLNNNGGPAYDVMCNLHPLGIVVLLLKVDMGNHHLEKSENQCLI